jgi:hypothetical protein
LCSSSHGVGFCFCGLELHLNFPLSSATLDFMRASPSTPLALHFRIDVNGTFQILLPHMAVDGATPCF